MTHLQPSDLHAVLLLALWRTTVPLAVRTLAPPPGDAPVLLVSCDTHTLVGSRGDDAMMSAIIARLRAMFPGSVVVTAASDSRALAAARARGFAAFAVWGRVGMAFRMWRRVVALRPQAAVLMGADIMDGHYSPVEALRRLITADILARCGVPVAIVGFSLNAQVPAAVRWAFRRLHPGVQLMLRDPVSLARSQALFGTGMPGTLVADTAFLLEPDTAGAGRLPEAAWIAQQKTAGRTVVALNFHPMLFPPAQRAQSVPALCRALACAMAQAAAQRPVSWLLLPHDDRPAIGDVDALAQLERELEDSGLRWQRMVAPPDAATIKGLVGALDGVLTGRMHLAIACLGRGVPVLALAYQGKFEGLMQHFELPDWLTLHPDALEPAALSTALDRFIGELPALAAKVQRRWPAVQALAARNFEGLGPR